MSLASMLVLAAGQAAAQDTAQPIVVLPDEPLLPLIIEPAWLRGPGDFDLSPFYPETSAEGRTATIEVECAVLPEGRLARCAPLGDRDAAAPFLWASLRVVSNFRLPPLPPPPGMESGAAAPPSPFVARVRFALDWAPPADVAAYDRLVPATILEPEAGADGGGEYPERAASRGIESGVVAVMCLARATGALESCSARYEEPTGAGFGVVAVRTIRRRRVTPATLDGEPIDDLVVTRVFFRLEDAVPAASAQDSTPAVPAR